MMETLRKRLPPFAPVPLLAGLAALAVLAALACYHRDHLAPLFPEALWQQLIAASLAVLALATLLALVPRFFAGAMSPSERRQLHAPGLPARAARWLGGAVPFAAAFAAFLAAAWLVVPLRTPVSLLLHSRSALSSQSPAGLASAASDMAGAERASVDLGPAVDRLLEHCRRAGAEAWLAGTPEQRRQLHRLVVEHQRELLPDTLLQGLEPLSVVRSRLPRWLVESVEISAASLAVARLHVREIRVAAAPSAGIGGSWPLAAEVFKARGIQAECLRPDTALTAGLAVERIASAVLHDGSKHRLEFVAVVRGRISTDAPLEFRLSPAVAAGDPFRFTVALKADKDERRVLFARTVLKEAPAWLSEKPLLVADAAGCSVAPVRRSRAGDKSPPGLFLASVPVEARWTRFFDLLHDHRELPAGPSPGAPFPKDLANQGLAMPKLGRDVEGLSLVEREDWLLLAVGADHARRAADHYGRGRQWGTSSPSSTVLVDASSLRVSRSLHAPATALTWHGLPIAGSDDAKAPSLVLRATSELFAFAWADRVEKHPTRGRTYAGDPQHRSRPVVQAGRLGADGPRFVVVEAGAPIADVLPFDRDGASERDRAAGYEPACAFSLAWTIAWANRHLRQSPFESADMEGASTSFDQEQVSGPVVQPEDLIKSVGTGQRNSDFVCLAIVGSFFALLGWRIRRCLAGARPGESP